MSSGFKSTLDGIGVSYNLEHIDTVDESLVKDNQHKELYVMFYGGSIMIDALLIYLIGIVIYIYMQWQQL